VVPSLFAFSRPLVRNGGENKNWFFLAKKVIKIFFMGVKNV
jgi:hypothetical protein